MTDLHAEWCHITGCYEPHCNCDYDLYARSYREHEARQPTVEEAAGINAWLARLE